MCSCLRIINEMPQFGASLTDNSIVVIYKCNMFIIQATGINPFRYDSKFPARLVQQIKSRKFLRSQSWSGSIPCLCIRPGQGPDQLRILLPMFKTLFSLVMKKPNKLECLSMKFIILAGIGSNLR